MKDQRYIELADVLPSTGGSELPPYKEWRSVGCFLRGRLLALHQFDV